MNDRQNQEIFLRILRKPLINEIKNKEIVFWNNTTYEVVELSVFPKEWSGKGKLG